jgi:SAM-dependent methyltransferase
MPCRWNKAAKLRREQIESGLDITFNRVFVPYFLRITRSRRPSRILEVGCGTGHLAAKLATVCSHVEALEPSPGMHAVAKEVLGNSAVQLHSSTIEKFRARPRFELVLSHLCGHVVADIETFCQACSDTVSNRGLFLFSLPHPCFWNEYREPFPRNDFYYAEERFTYITLTITKDPGRPIERLPFHHRPLGRYVAALNKCGMALTQLDEIVPPKAIQQLYGKQWRFPRYCVLHATRISGQKSSIQRLR